MMRIAIGLLTVAAFVLAVTLAQGIGEAIGAGLQEHLVR